MICSLVVAKDTRRVAGQRDRRFRDIAPEIHAAAAGAVATARPCGYGMDSMQLYGLGGPGMGGPQLSGGLGP